MANPSMKCSGDDPSGIIKLPWQQLKTYTDNKRDLDMTVSFSGAEPTMCYRTDGGWGYGDVFIDDTTIRHSIQTKGGAYWKEWCPSPAPCPVCQKATVWPFVLAFFFVLALMAATFFVGRRAGIKAGEKMAASSIRRKMFG